MDLNISSTVSIKTIDRSVKTAATSCKSLENVGIKKKKKPKLNLLASSDQQPKLLCVLVFKSQITAVTEKGTLFLIKLIIQETLMDWMNNKTVNGSGDPFLGLSVSLSAGLQRHHQHTWHAASQRASQANDVSLSFSTKTTRKTPEKHTRLIRGKTEETLGEAIQREMHLQWLERNN